ncbi:PD40 domain-containing protein [Kitasatospora aureofaciens]|uniref:TolB-like translocation protein n=1 Tax=Kitasatospora aureofaciens TaxID=1894 RepID=A0A1E7MWE2_KITAU|nr:PD40 domain-containing protein [Kitasatospora aureofaciens]QEU99421.1 TolB-like translocation protein [Streptomyces viridifaciens]ARF78205.1 TolB-like translocation protein [Kitasatospora aureofaciens]OEV32750.1 TolB-like translocation protein [Kitasatospora aureofaciens]UKZ05504.1 PD40 domain-containing protein [Streptomyces viridifaciens]GGU80977.1 TolB-like translocation protein; signal peptide [Kitasatospora aureofaciens]
MNPQNNRTRVIVLLVAVLVLGAVGTGAVLYAADRTARRDQPQSGGPAVTPGNVSLQAPSAGRQLLFRNMAWGPHRDEITTVPADHPDGPRTASGTQCLRFHAAAGTGICLQAEHGALEDTYRAVVLDDHLHQRRSFPAAGIPTRARVSPSGHLAAWTVFVSGDSYAGTNFSTRTSIVDVRDWNLRENLEDFAVIKDGRPYQAHDVNIWGVTFADDNTFYATLATSGQTHLVRGDLAARTLTTLHDNVECPSLSPDGTRIAYKKRVPGLSPDAPWRLYVLDLATGAETATAEQRNIDDQALWSDDGTLLYALPGDYGADLWTVPADGSGAARLVTKAAVAPAYLG